MSLEYAMQGQFSNKSDLYSFGVLILEIISAKKNSSFYQSDHAEDLLSHTWRLWKNGTPMDPTIGDSYTRNEVIKCIHISLLCVQEVPYDRPSMAFIVLMLNSYSSIRIRSICNQVYWCCANWIQKSQLAWFVHSIWYWGRRKSISPLASDKAFLGPNKLILDELFAYLRWPKGLELEKDTCSEASHKVDSMVCE
ncbi:Cysteine-rich receptor-like protein kinase 10 [Vitis vinifera]|uniref:Cysteine-rich receptor-like protein kinase 10 n=1 Tax=Vitis vinifera TaxID=29760 RepID=A0A438G6H4_VITVI|nr:Cysteine-rich receptor-like protein kinase 10 [Vitis vinifera]